MIRCTVCLHVDRKAIDRKLLAGSSVRNTAKQHGLTPAAVHRHRHHTAKLIAVPLASTVPHPDPVSFLDHLRRIVTDLQRVAEKAEESEDYGPTVAALREQTRVVELVVRAAEAQAERSATAWDSLSLERRAELLRAELEDIERQLHPAEAS